MGRSRARALSSRADFQKVFRNGRVLRAAHLVVHAAERPLDGPGRFAVVVSRKHGGAVQRNRIRRRIRELVRRAGGPPDGSDTIWVPKPGIARLSFEQVQQEVREVMGKIGNQEGVRS